MDASSQDVQWMLHRINKRERCPQELAKWLREVDETDGFEPTLFQTDEIAWLAYRLTLSAAQQVGHFDGQAALKRQIQELKKDTPEKREQVFLAVKDLLSLETRKKGTTWLDNMPPPKKKRRRTIGEDEDVHQDPRTTPTSLEAATPIPPQVTTVPEIPTHNVLLNASLSAVGCIFPRSLANATVRIPHPHLQEQVASLSMFVPYDAFDSLIGYEMRIDITANRVPYLARELFDADVETQNGVRVINTDTWSLTPSPSVVLRRCRRDKIKSTFGDEVGGAIMASLAYLHDEKNHFHTTFSVNMEFSHNASEKGTLAVLLGLYEGSQIAEKLYNDK